MIVRIAASFALIALFAGTAPAATWAQQGASAPIPSPGDDAASSMSQINPTAGPSMAPAINAATAQRKILSANAPILVNAREHRETKALNWLEAAGDNDFNDLRRDGSNYRATVIRDGTPQMVIVDPDSGAITPAD
jgi:hypothetical protein